MPCIIVEVFVDVLFWFLSLFCCSIPLNPSVGLSLKRRRGSQRVWTSVANDDTLNSVFITQDNM